MSELRPCPCCGGEMHVRMYDEDFYHAALGPDFECDPEYEVQHVDRLAAINAKCPLEMECYESEAEAIDAWNRRADDDADLIPEVVRRLEEFERTGGETVSLEEIMAEDGWVRERTCIREKHGTKMDGSPRLRCSLCGYGIGDKRWKYCPSCGAEVVSE